MDFSIPIENATNHIESFFQKKMEEFQTSQQKEFSKVSLLLQNEMRKSLSDECLFTPNYKSDFIDKLSAHIHKNNPHYNSIYIYKGGYFDSDEYIISLYGQFATPQRQLYIGPGIHLKIPNKSQPFWKGTCITNKLNILYFDMGCLYLIHHFLPSFQ